MDEHVDLESLDQAAGSAADLVRETWADYLGRWNRLVSTTNWEKGRIICQWRQSLSEAGVPRQAYSDEAWSRRVGTVSSQHVGRLRRVYRRFGGQYEQYPGLYWSHFQAALDWPDAEMWLEGAVQSSWSVAQMRLARWEAIGAPADQKPREEDIITAELDEDAAAPDEATLETIDESLGEIRDLDADDGPQARRSGPDDVLDLPPLDEAAPPPEEIAAVEPVRPFEDLPPLPDDLSEAFEAFKLAILHHKLSKWQEISRDDVLATLDALKQLVLAPGSHG